MLKNNNFSSLFLFSENQKIVSYCDLVVSKFYGFNVFKLNPESPADLPCVRGGVVLIDACTAVKFRMSGMWRLLRERISVPIVVFQDSGELKLLRSVFVDENLNYLCFPFSPCDIFSFHHDSQKSVGDSSCFADDSLDSLIGISPAMMEVKRLLVAASASDFPMLFLGESGTGKTVAARTCHEMSARKNKPFFMVNMANITPELADSSLFGAVRGAYTGAVNRKGYFASADGGTLFLDEIGEMPLDCQAKLLHVIENGTYRSLGSDDVRTVDVRLVFATNADLKLMVKEHRFREDLYWRIADFPIRMPPLRERYEDIPILAEHFLKEYREKYKISYTLTDGALVKLRMGFWSGNIRQFRSCLNRACIYSMQTGIILPESIILD